MLNPGYILSFSLLDNLLLPLQRGEGWVGGCNIYTIPYMVSSRIARPCVLMRGIGYCHPLFPPGCMHAPVRRGKGPLELYLFPSHPLEGEGMRGSPACTLVHSLIVPVGCKMHLYGTSLLGLGTWLLSIILVTCEHAIIAFTLF